MAVSVWWDRVATAEEHAQVLRALDLDEALAGVPWAFLPEAVQQQLRDRIVLTPYDSRALHVRNLVHHGQLAMIDAPASTAPIMANWP